MTTNPWIENWLSSPRFGRYLDECNGDRDSALELYEWNLTLGYSVLRDIAHFEVALRNAYSRELSNRWINGSSWLTDPTSPIRTPISRRISGKSVDVNSRNRKAIDEVIPRLGNRVTADRIVAELPFGFWAHMTDAIHERTLWIPYIRHVWPRGTSRAGISQSIGRINYLRNRIAHHEPIFSKMSEPSGVISVHQDLIENLTMLLPEAGAYVATTSTFQKVLNQNPLLAA